MVMDSVYPVYAVILAGGQGTRLWPISRKDRPKQFLDLSGTGRSLLQDTVRRALELTGSLLQVIVLTGRGQVEWVCEQLPELPKDNILTEPVSRNTAPGLGLAAFHLASLTQTSSHKAVMITLPVDHMFKDEVPWFQAVRTAIQVAAGENALVAIGLKPLSPATGYGYQQLGEEISNKSSLKVHKVEKFIEKPSHPIAEEFIKSGQYLWNTGTYVWKINVFLEALKKYAPSIFTGLASLRMPVDQAALDEVYPNLEKISVDHAVIEKASNVLTVKSDFERIDIGSLDSLAEVWDQDPDGNTGFGEFLSVQSKDNIVYNEDGLVALVGVEDLVVIRTRGVILVCPRDRVQDIKDLVESLTGKGQEDYL